EGIAAEVVYNGDHRAITPFVDPGTRDWASDLQAAGYRAWHRWMHDAFGAHPDRLLLVANPGQGTDRDAMLEELNWVADHGYHGAYVPGFLPTSDVPPLSDPWWDPYWATCVDRGLPLYVHAGHGVQMSTLYDAAKVISARMAASDDPDVDWAQEFIALITTKGDFFADPRPRRPLWQLTLGGVFDRFPELRLVLTEIRGDWLPATLAHLDEVFAAHRDDLATSVPPSEHWRTNCLTSLSFVHRSEVEMRHEIGIDTISFGRDYPHEEATWPNTREWVHDAFAGVPEAEVRAMLGDNAIRFLDLDRAPLQAIADGIGPTLDEVAGPRPEIDPILLAHMDGRGGYLKPPEGDSRLDEVVEMMSEDLPALGVA
ncbi:MAG TPA: amidohydrolase family protein, partial [Acidimicrobiales bacterium]